MFLLYLGKRASNLSFDYSNNKAENDTIDTTTEHTMVDELMQNAETDAITQTVPSEEEIQEYRNETFSKFDAMY